MSRKLSRHTTLDPKVLEILQNITAAAEEGAGDNAAVADSATQLQILYERLTNGREQALRPGRLAVWKRGLKNRRFPAYGAPAIVVEVREQPVTDTEHDSGVPYFQEPLDLLLGILHESGDFLVYHFDRRRFEPYDVSTDSNKQSHP